MSQPPARPRPPSPPPAPGREPTPGPPADLYREGNALVLVVALPGLTAGDFRISLVGNRQVYIDGTAPYRHPVPPESMALAERSYGPFSRKIDLPLPVDARGARLRFERGILTARLPLQMHRLRLQWPEGGGSAP